MTTIKDVPTALPIFEVAAIKHADATKEGDYKTGNKNYKKVIQVVDYLKSQHKLDELLNFLNHENVGVRLAAATFLLPTHEMEGTEVLEEIANSSDFFSFIAETTLSEWNKGNLKL